EDPVTFRRPLAFMGCDLQSTHAVCNLTNTPERTSRSASSLKRPETPALLRNAQMAPLLQIQFLVSQCLELQASISRQSVRRRTYETRSERRVHTGLLN